jgi:feruloyl esterase
MEAQRYPYDFDGIVAEGPVNFLQAMAANNIWTFQRMYSDDFAGNLAFDTDGDGVPDSLTKLTMLAEAVLAKCDERDGFTDRVIDDPLSCDFDPRADLSAMMCPGDVDADDCFTAAQLQTIEDVYRGAYDSNGTVIYKGKSFGSESGWARWIVPHQGNNLNPWFFALYATYANYLFYESDPGVPPATLTDPTVTLDKARTPPEWAWWEFDVDDVTSGAGDVMASIFDSADPDLAPYLLESDGKLILIHGWMDAGPNPEPTLDYYNAVVESTFDGDVDEARSRARLFMAPGMGHCGGGPGPNSWDKLAPLVDWVESGIVPDHVVATHTTDGVVDNERKICAYPDQAVYVGPEGGQNDPANWIESNFACEAAR